MIISMGNWAYFVWFCSHIIFQICKIQDITTITQVSCMYKEALICLYVSTIRCTVFFHKADILNRKKELLTRYPVDRPERPQHSNGPDRRQIYIFHVQSVF